MDVLLIRHGYAGDPDPTEYPDDSERPLTSKGASKFVKAAKGLKQVIKPEKMLASSAKRTWQTAHLLNRYADWPKPEKSDTLEDGSPPGDAAKQLQKLYEDGASSVALVGHEPQLSALISFLLTGEAGDVTTKLKKGGAAYLKLNGVEPGGCELMWVMPRRALARLRKPEP